VGLPVSQNFGEEDAESEYKNVFGISLAWLLSREESGMVSVALLLLMGNQDGSSSTGNSCKGTNPNN
jgi:hypothetical protein